MKKTYFFLFTIVFFELFFNMAFGQARNDYASIPNGSATTVVIQDVLANDTYLGAPVTLSDVYFSQISSTGNYLTLDTDSGSLLFTNGPAPIGMYYLDYMWNLIGESGFENAFWGQVAVNIGCDDLPAPIILSVTHPSCIYNGIVELTGLPATGTWVLTDFGRQSITGSGTSVTLIDVDPGSHLYRVGNSQGCYSLSVPVNVDFMSTSLTGTYSDANADGIPNAGDVINYQCALTNLSSCAVTNIHSYGIAFTEATLPLLAPGETHDFTGTYTLVATDFNYPYLNKTVYFEGVTNLETTYSETSCNTYYQSQPDGIKLVAYVDSNANGVKDINEQEFHNGSFNYEINNDGTTHYLASGGSPVIYQSNPANTYDLNFSVYAAYGSYYTIVGGPYMDITIAAGSGITAYYFALTALPATPYVDTAITLHGTNPRPGFTYTNTIVYSNNGSEIIPSGTVTFTKNNAVSIIEVSQAGTVSTPDGFTYNFTNLLPGEWNHLTVTMQVPTIPTVTLGQSLTNSVAITIPANDANVGNNSSSLTQTIIGSYDPNDKAESHGGKILYSGFTAEDYLTYTIRFENTGTANAEFVRVVDVLNDKLDETSVRMIDASDNYTLDRVGNTLTWFFDNIQLPPSVPNDVLLGHGYIVFQVKPKPGFVLGDVIDNTADIYFDFNPAIVTNTFTSEFVNTLRADDFTFDQLAYYPNPVKNVLSLSNNMAIDSVTITSVLGQEVLSKKINEWKAEIDLSRLSHGIYFVKVYCGNQVKIIKIIKE
jgi:hypothetical protein